MPHVEPVSPKRAGLLTRFAYWYSQRKFGKVAAPLAVTAHHPQIFRAYTAFEFMLSGAKRVPERLKALAGIRAAMLVGCPY
jgi:hypothetical protein